MRDYEVEFTWRGHRYTDTFRACSYFAARRLVEDRYPGASIWHVRAL